MNRGFTLTELITAIAVFVVVMTISMGSLINITEANRKTKTLKIVLNNLNLAVESMSKEIRFGRNYNCGSTGDLTLPRNCTGSGDSQFNFLSSGGLLVNYRFNNNSIEKQVDGEGYIAITAPEIVIEDLVFLTVGAGTSDTLQPKVLIKVKSHAGIAGEQSDLTLQTLVSQRFLDI